MASDLHLKPVVVEPSAWFFWPVPSFDVSFSRTADEMLPDRLTAPNGACLCVEDAIKDNAAVLRNH